MVLWPSTAAGGVLEVEYLNHALAGAMQVQIEGYPPLHLAPTQLWLLVLTSPCAHGLPAAIGAMRAAGARRGVRLIAEIGLAPAILHRVGAHAPQHWAAGADAVLIGSGAEPELVWKRQIALEQEWARVFPGLSLPEGVL